MCRLIASSELAGAFYCNLCSWCIAIACVAAALQASCRVAGVACQTGFAHGILFTEM